MRVSITVLIVGFAIGALLRGISGDAPADPSQRSEPTVRERSRAPATEGATAVAEPPLAESGVRTPSTTSGGGEIAGRVRDDRGDPIEGARIVMTSREAVASKARKATSDAAGFFSLAGLPPGSIKLAVDVGDPAARIEYYPEGAVSRGDWVEVIVGRSWPVAFDVRHADGSIPARATIAWGDDPVSWVPGKVFRVPPGDREFVVTIAGQETRFRRVIREPRVERPIEAILPWSGGVAVTVSLPEPTGGFSSWWAVPPRGRPIDGEWILRHADRFEGVVGVVVSRSLPSEAVIEHFRAEEPGVERVTIAGLPPAEYVIAVGRTPDAVDAWQVVAVGEEVVPVTLAVTPTSEAPGLTAIVLDAAGDPIDSVLFRLTWRRAQSVEDLQLTVVRREDGHWWLGTPPIAIEILEQRARGALWLEVSAENGTRTMELTSTVAEVRFRELATLEVHVIGLGEEEPCGVSLRTADGGSIRYSPLTGTSVTYSVEAGEVQLAVQSYASFFALDRSEPVWLTLEPGKNEVTIELPELSSLEIDLSSVGEWLSFSVVRRDGGWGRTHPGQPFYENFSGTAVVDGLLPGEYSIELSTRGAPLRTMTVSIPVTTRVRFEGQIANALTFHFPEHVDDGLFRDGDVIFGVEGRVFETIDDYVDAFRWREKEVLPVDVERNGREIVVPVSLSQLQLLQARGVALLATVRE